VYFAGQEIRACNSLPDAETLHLVARPEKISIASPGEAGSEANYFSAVVKNVSFEGESYAVAATLTHGHEIMLRLPTMIVKLPKEGEIVTLALLRQDALVVRGDA